MNASCSSAFRQAAPGHLAMAQWQCLRGERFCDQADAESTTETETAGMNENASCQYV